MKKMFAFLLLMLAGGATAVFAQNTVNVTFWRQAHHTPYLAVTLLCDGVNEGTRIAQNNQSLHPQTHSFDWTVGSCDELTLVFTGVVYSGLGQKIDDVSLTVNGGSNLIVNGTFDTGLQSWENPDIGTDGQNGGWTWAKGRKQQAKLDGEGAGSNAVWGESYRLRQTVSTP